MKIFIFRKRNLVGLSICGIVLLLVFLTGIYIYNNKPISAVYQEKKTPIYSVETNQKEVAFGFNVAWGNNEVDDILRILKDYEVKSTFFFTGEFVSKYPQDVQKIYSNGHGIQNHSNSHPHVASISKEELIKDTKDCDDKIEKLIGIRPTLYRAPYGEYNNTMMETFESNLGHKVIQWDVDSRDWKKEYSTDKIVDTVLKSIKNGSIVLFHVGKENTVNALPIILSSLLDQDYVVKDVESILIKDNYYIDSNGTMKKK